MREHEQISKPIVLTNVMSSFIAYNTRLRNFSFGHMRSFTINVRAEVFFEWGLRIRETRLPEHFHFGSVLCADIVIGGGKAAVVKILKNRNV